LEAASSPGDHSYTTGSYQIRAVDPPLATATTGSRSAIIPVSSGDQTLTAAPAPEVFDFSDVRFGNDTIVGFDPTQDAIRLGNGQAGGFAAVQADMSATAGGTLIALDASRSIMLSGVAAASLAASNFRFG